MLYADRSALLDFVSIAGEEAAKFKPCPTCAAQSGVLAVEDKTVRFHILDDKHKARVKQHMIDPDSGDEVASEEIQKGYEVEPGKFVILTEEDLEKLAPPPSREPLSAREPPGPRES